jgi:hypothetical protein
MNRLYDDAYNHRGGNLLFRVLLQSDIDVYTKIKINKYNYEIEADKYSRDLCDILYDSFEARKDVLDDAIPSLSVNLGIGDYSAFVTGDIYFSSDTSWSRPTLKNLKDFRNIEPLGTAPWYKKFLQICEYIMTNTKCSGIPFARGFFSPLDLAEALRGQDIYTDFYDDPDGVHELLNYCADATIKFAEDIYSIAKKYAGNEKYSMWFMDGSINMSEDIACMISANTYREFAAPHTQRVINHFGKGFMHTHSRAMYMVKEICSLDNVVNLWLATDPNQPRPIDCLERLVEDANGVCLAIDCLSMDEIEKNMKIALKGNVSLCLPVVNIQEGITSVKKFRELTEKNM